MNTPAPCARLSVITVPSSTKAVVFRRGPSKHVCSILWDRADNSVQIGQWLKGRIYPEFCDLSPDAKHMIYVAADHKTDSETSGQWNAVSRPPWLTAVYVSASIPPFVVGGAFVNNKRFWIDELCSQMSYAKRITSRPEVSTTPPLKDFPKSSGISRVQYIRAMRDGWRMRNSDESMCVLEKRIFSDAILVRKISGYGSKEAYSIEGRFDLDAQNCTWLDVIDNHIYFAKDGCIFVQRKTKKGEVEHAELLHDFNNLTFTTIEAPYAGVEKRPQS